jgi:hypothetical protein
VLIVLGALGLASAAALVLSQASDEEADPTYTDATRRAFLDACTADGGDDVAESCGCLYDAIAAEIPYERYREVSDQLLASPPVDGPLALPEDFQALVRGCRRAAPLPS